MPPAPSVVLSGYEELLEVAEAILFSHAVALPPTVLDKYRLLQREVKERIHSASMLSDSATDFASTAPSLRSPLQAGESERNVILAEKLAQSKKKTAELRAQVSSLEGQLHQMTLRVQQLHAMHADSAKELVAQTKHACESANQRVLAELELKLQHEAGAARKNAADALESERAFHASIVRKIEAMEVMFPAEYAGLRASQESMADHMAQGANPLLAAMSPGSSRHGDRAADGSNPISMTRLHLNSFFESTRAALNHSNHYRRDLSEVLLEVRELRGRVKIEEEARFAMDKAARNVLARVDELQHEIGRAASATEPTPPRSAVVRERDEIVAGVREVERRIKEQQSQRQQADRLRLPSATAAASASSSAAPSFRASTAALDAAIALSPRSAGRRASVERDAESSESEADGHGEQQRERSH